MNSSEAILLTTTTENSTTAAVHEYETEIPSTVTTPSMNDNDSTQDTVTIVNTIFDHLGTNITDNDYTLTTLPSIINDSLIHLEELVTKVNDLGADATDNINKTDNDYIPTTLPSIVTDSVYHLEDIVTKVNESFINITNIFNGTEYNSITETTIIDDDYNSATLPTFINDSIHHLEDIDAKDIGPFINITNIINDTEYNSKNETIDDLLRTSTEIYLTTDITVAPQSEGNVSLNVIINNILNTTINDDQLSIFINSTNNNATKDLPSSIVKNFNNISNETLVLPLHKSLANNFTSEIFQSVSNINNSSYEATPSVTHWIDDGAAVENLLFVSYYLVFPILIFAALIFNCLALYVFRKPKLASLSESSYLQFLSGMNILCALNAIPATILKNHCPFTTFSSAFYYTYFSWTTIFLFRSLSICSLVWMSYDKFLYIWSLSYLQKLIQPTVVRKRLILSTIVILIAFLPLICLGKVENCKDVSPTCNVNQEENWLSFAGYRRDLDDTWFAVLIIFLVQGTTHIILILLTISLFTGLRQKIFKRRKRQMDQTIVLIINNSSYLFLDVMYVITALFFYKYKYDQGHCYNTFSRERLMAIVNCLLMFWSSFSTLIFLLQSRAYRNQVMSILFRCFTWDTDEKVRKSVRHSIQLQQIKKPEVTQL